MPFYGVLPQRQHLFQPQPVSAIGVNDAHAWRLNPRYHHVYDKLQLALTQGLLAAPCGVNPLDLGLSDSSTIFVKPITNLAGMSIDAQAMSVAQLNHETKPQAGQFWCTCLQGTHTSTDCLVLEGKVVWFAHTLAASLKDQQRPLYWQIGIDLAEREAQIVAWVAQQLAGYTGLCNVEMIGEHIIEMHLRGSNGFFDFYGAGFITAWGHLVDFKQWQGLEPIQQGIVYSLFGQGDLPPNYQVIAQQCGVRIVPDTGSAGRRAIIYATELAAAQQAAAYL